MTDILILHAKYGDIYYDITTPERKVGAALDMLKTWLRDGYIYEPTNPATSEKEWSAHPQEELDLSALELDPGTGPGADAYNAKILKARARIAHRSKTYQDDKARYDQIVKVVADWDSSYEFVPREDLVYDSGKHVPLAPLFRSLAWSLFQGEADGEYQGYEIETLEEVV